MNLVLNIVCINNSWCSLRDHSEKVTGLRTFDVLLHFILAITKWHRYGYYDFFNCQQHTQLTSANLKSVPSCDLMTTASLIRRNHHSHFADLGTLAQRVSVTLSMLHSQQVAKWKWTQNRPIANIGYTECWRSKGLCLKNSVPFNLWAISAKRETTEITTRGGRTVPDLHFPSGSQSNSCHTCC